MANRKPQARHAGFRLAGFLSLEEARNMDRNGQVMFQNFEHSLSGLDGLAAIDEANNFKDGDIIVGYFRVCENKGYQAPQGRKVQTVDGTSTAAEAAEDLPLS